MTRETRTLKCLFPDPKPPRRKNFIKENVKSLRRMEQLFHTSNNSAKDLKLPVLRQTKASSKHGGGVGDNQTVDNHESSQELEAQKHIENGMSRLQIKNFLQKEQSNRKKSAPVISSKKVSSKKLSRSSVNGNLTRKLHGLRDLTDQKLQNHQKLKAYSDADLAHEKLNKHVDNDESDVKCKNQGVQTLDAKDISSLYSEGVIRYPSGRTKETQRSKHSDREDAAPELESDEIDDQHNLENSADGVDYVKLNKERISLASKLASQLNNNPAPQSYRVGVVPKYIKERKEALEKERLAKAAAQHTDCPIGHVPLPDNERKETLSMLKKNYQEYVSELNMLPIRTDTLRSQKRKMEIEKQLTKLEEAIKVFTRPKVFVKVDS